MAALFVLVGFPLIIRRRAPLVPVVLLMTAVAVQAVEKLRAKDLDAFSGLAVDRHDVRYE